MLRLLLFILLFSCTDSILYDKDTLNSIQLNDNAWIHIRNHIDDENDISIIDDQFTLEFWFTGGNTGSSKSACLVSIIGQNGEINFGLFKDPNSPKAFEVWLDDTRLESIELNINEDLNSSNIFHHIAITSNQYTEIYLNGSKIKIIEEKININDNDLVIAGKVNQSLSVLDNFWIGNIDEMRLWSTVLNDSVIQFHVSNPYKVSESYEDDHVSTLTGLWKFQFEPGSTSPIVYDESCELLTQIYTYSSSCNNYDAIIYTLGNNVATFSEKKP